MQTIDIFSFDSYRDFLLSMEAERPRGFRAQIARTIQCRSAFVSQVLNGKLHFSLEQAERISDFLGQDEAEAEYFLLLIQTERAGTISLKRKLKKQVIRQQENRQRFKHRLKLPSLDQEKQLTYYSSWKYIAVHVAASLPKLVSPEHISQYLGIPVSQVSSIITFLLKAGLLRQEGSHLAVAQTKIHLEDDSLYIGQHHRNLRTKAMEALDRADVSSYATMLHYSSLASMSANDAQLIRSTLQKAIENTKGIIAKSGDEVVYGFNMDFYPISQAK